MKKILILLLCLFVINAQAKTIRSQEAKDQFKLANPCPSNGRNYGACPGYIIDHITPIACGGADDPSNMQWQTKTDAKLKDKWERKSCQLTSQRLIANNFSRSQTDYNNYYSGPRGGCYTYTESGKKRYVDHSFCY